MSDDRPKRPTLDRTKPFRSWAAAFGIPFGAGVRAPDPARLDSAVQRSVDLGYRVVDDYIQQGQRAAQILSEGKITTEVLTNEMNDIGARIARYASDFFGAWVELLELAAAGTAVRQTATNGAPEAVATAAGAPPPRPQSSSRVRVAVTAGRPVEVVLDLHAERATGALRAHHLRSADAKKPRLTDVAIAPEGAEATPVLRIRVPDDHPDGTYEGLLIDEATNRPVGSVRLIVSGAPRRAPARPGRPRRPRKRTGRARR